MTYENYQHEGSIDVDIFDRFPYTVELALPIDGRSIVEWRIKHLDHKNVDWLFNDEYDHILYLFKYQEDAVAFKLRWGQ